MQKTNKPMRIRQLPKEVYDLIAAGEVVLAPVSVVKELVENSLDAGASRITIEIKGGGIGMVRVYDNGSGIAREDIGLSFMPHATSKLGSAEDLSRIATLGFRGEALASIAAVSAVTMVTKAEGEETGTRADIEGGSGLVLSQAGADRGTDITVRQLFFNIPARKKHMGGERTEGRKIGEYLAKAAVSRPGSAIRLISDSALVFATLGNGDRLAAIASAYGSKTAENLLPVLAISSSMRLEGYISGALGLRGNRKGQHVFVNGRPVENAAAIESAVSRAYREFAEPGRFPVVFLFLSVDTEMVDVNVHPAKSEVSFAEAEKVGAFVEDAIREMLLSGRAIPRLRAPLAKTTGSAFTLKPEAEAGATLVSTSGGAGEKVVAVDIEELLPGSGASAHGAPDEKSGVHYGGAGPGGEASACGAPEGKTGTGDSKSIMYTTHDEGASQGRRPGLSENTGDTHYEASFNIGGLQVLAALFATYILATDGDMFYIIDQHAAHERVNFERFLSAAEKGGAAAQGLLTPYLFTLPATLKGLAGHLEFFAKLGYEIDEFGDRTWAARTFPAYITYEEAEAFMLETLAAIGDEKNAGEGISGAAVERVMMRACKASVKANRGLSGEEGAALLEALSGCANPYTCPHGRPVFLKLSRADIERLFKRA
ncbi:MAG: DNA mismatch repair endonuclease MutL [Clostridiales bacterium]|nr:DNA mismatch repair endonuclease MutL [Clostridiales bacterium]